MDKLLIRGGHPRQGEVAISGAENAALPELCAALLAAEPVRLKHVPRLQDVSTTLRLLRQMGAVADGTDASGHTVSIDAGPVNSPAAPCERVKTIRAQIAVERGNLIAKTTRLKGARITTDRIEAGTVLCAVAATGGDVVLRGTRADPLDAVLDKLREAGVDIDLRASASLVIAGLGGRRRNPHRPHLPPGPRLRRHGSQAARPGCRHRAGEMTTPELASLAAPRGGAPGPSGGRAGRVTTPELASLAAPRGGAPGPVTGLSK